MNRRDFTKVVGGAVAGIVAGSKLMTGVAHAGEEAAADKHVCKGRNECKGKGGCASDAARHECKGKNECKGMGGCKAEGHGCAAKNECKGQGGCAVPLKAKKKDDKPK